jgi:hypothetical protein
VLAARSLSLAAVTLTTLVPIPISSLQSKKADFFFSIFFLVFNFFSFFSSYYQLPTCASGNLVYAAGLVNNMCYVDDAGTGKYDFPYLYRYNATVPPTLCTGTPASTINVVTKYPCSLDGGNPDDDGNIVTGSYLQYSEISAAKTNVYLNFGVLASLMLVVTQLWKN